VIDLLYAVVGGLFVFSMLNFALFLKNINPDYLNTFFSTITGKHFAVVNFLEAKTDDLRFEVFGHHRSYYESIVPENWIESCPDWFTATAISQAPSDMLPTEVLVSMGGEKGRNASIISMQEEANKPIVDRGRRGTDLKLIPPGGGNPFAAAAAG